MAADNPAQRMSFSIDHCWRVMDSPQAGCLAQGCHCCYILDDGSQGRNADPCFGNVDMDTTQSTLPLTSWHGWQACLTRFLLMPALVRSSGGVLSGVRLALRRPSEQARRSRMHWLQQGCLRSHLTFRARHGRHTIDFGAVVDMIVWGLAGQFCSVQCRAEAVR